MSDELSVKLQNTKLQESWGELINPYEFAQDLRDDFGGVVFSAYSTIYDRSDGRYRPVYETEMDLRRVRAMAWTLAETVPGAQAWINRLVDYTIGTGFDWSATSKENPQLAIAVKGWIDQVLENSNWSSGLERESFAREVADGEYVGQLEQSSGSCCITTYEPDELTAPLRVRDLDEWLDLDFVSSWSFGVLTKQNRPAKHYGYHFVHDAAGSDWNYVKAEDAIFWRRNGRSNAKRGFSDFHRVFLHLARSNLVLTNTAEGAATQAAIAYIVEHAQTTTRSDIERMAQADSYVGNTPDPLTGQLVRKKRMRPGTRIDTKGGKYQAGPLGTNNSQVYIAVMEALLRIAGSVHAFPEGMLTGSYANNNFASSLTAEAPFVQGRMADQASRAMRVKTLLKRIVAVGHKFGVFRSFGEVSLEQILGTVELSVIPSKIVHRDPKEMTEALKMQKDAGWVSDKTAMTELGRDYDVEMENGAKPAGDPNQAAPGSQDAMGQQQAIAGQQTGQDAAGANPGVWMGLSRQQFIRNQKALNDIVSGLAAGTLGKNSAKVMLSSIGMPKESIELLMQDMVDKKLDAEMPSGQAIQESLKRKKECKDDAACGCRSKRVKHLRERYQKKRAQAKLRESFQEALTPDTQPRGKDGKWIYSGVKTDHWNANNSAANSAKKSIKLMEKLVALGKFDELAAIPVADPATMKLNSYQKGKWQAKQNLMAMKQVDVTPKNAEPTAPESPVLSGWKKVGDSLGTEKGGLYIGPDGKKYYVKTPDNPARAHNEVLASKLYQLTNANVVPANLVEVEGKLSVATPWAEDAAKIDWNSSLAKNAASYDFAAHAWLNNRDAVGAGTENPMDNIKWIGGVPTLVDAGGSLDYAGVGGGGKKPFGEMTEHMTMIDPKLNPTMAKVFGGITMQQRQESLKKVIAVSDQNIMTMVNKYHGGTPEEKKAMAATLIARKNKLKEVHDTVESLNQVKPKPEPTIQDAMKSLDAADADLAAKTADLTGMSLPPPPLTNSTANASVNKSLSKMHELAKSKDIEGLKAVPTSADSKQTYAKLKHKYKQQLLATLGAGGESNPAHVVAAPVAVKAAAAKPAKPAFDYMKLSAADLPPKPTFIGSNAEMNKITIQAIDKTAASGTSKAFVSISNIAATSKSPKVQAYASAVANKMAGISPPVSSASGVKPVAKPAAKSKAASVAETFAPGKVYGKYFVHDVPAVETKPLASVKLTPSADLNAYWTATGKKWGSVPGSMELQDYTGGGYTNMNNSLKNGNPSVPAKKAVMAHKALAVPMNEMIVSRAHDNALGGGIEGGVEAYKKMVGHVIHDNSMLSTSADHVVFSGKPVHLKIKTGPHVKAVYAKHFSGHPSEDEIITAPKQKMRILHVEEGEYYGTKKIIIHAEFLPTEDSQWNV